LEIFSFPKYNIYGVTIHKAYFFHWIDLQYIYETNTNLVSYSYAYICLLLQSYYTQYPITIIHITKL
jgi:hypothetical protein